MERMQSMFSNAFNTPAGQLVEKATSGHLATEDLALNMEICDAVGGYSDGPKDAVKAIKRRLSGNKNYNQISLTLSVLETCIKNCGNRFLVLVTTREFCREILFKTIHPKNTPPVVLQERVLGLIKQLAESFGSNPQMEGASQVYQQLKDEGYEFPKTQVLSNPSGGGSSRSAKRSNPQHHQPHQPRSQVSNPTPEQLAKLRKHMAIVVGNTKVLSEMLTELNPTNCDAPDIELMQELNRTCRAMQQRVVELLEQVGNEEITIELLKINDDLNNVFLRYERFERYRANRQSTPPTKPVEQPQITPYPTASFLPGPGPSASTLSPPVEPPPSYSDTEQPTPEVNDLIDLSLDPGPATNPKQTQNVTQELAGLSLGGVEPAASPSNSNKPLTEQLDAFGELPESEILQLGSSESEIEQWLSANGASLGIQPNAQPPQEAVTDDFSDFLNERATAASNLPSSQHYNQH
uniref:Target of Myb protein 1-like n=1 Tax=Phallusia mammillata TaxID=59560 RepID=A0A6F9DUQ7_9ASCI|nr:target of Myb protein 1-like [Phallusia mammillata]